MGKEFRVTGELRDTRGEPLAGEYLLVQVGDGPEQSALTDDSGAFEFTGEVDNAGEFLVRAEFAGDAPILPSKATARLVARHTVRLTLDVPTGLDQGGETAFTGRVTSGTLSPIGQLELTIEDTEGNQLATVTTAEDGSFEFTVHDSEELLDTPITFKYGGDDLNMPISYFLSVPMTPAGFNWPLWIGVPAVATVVIITGLAGRRVRAARLPAFLRRRPAAEAPPSEQSEAPEAEEPAHEEAGTGPQPVQLEIRFVKPAQDLPDVWGVGEEVAIEAGLVDSEGQAIGGATVEVSVVDGRATSQLVTDDAGACTLAWTAEELGEHVVSAQFAGDEERLVASAASSLRVVDFREEIVRLYNAFLGWAEERTTGISEQSTPREVELILVAEGATGESEVFRRTHLAVRGGRL